MQTQIPLRIAIVDDEPLAHDRLQEFIEKMPQKLTLVANFYSPDEAYNYMNSYQDNHQSKIDVLLMDINYSADGIDQEGLKFVKWTQDNPNSPLIIFVSAYDEYCAKALGLDIVDFLIKPTSPKRFEMAIHKAMVLFDHKKNHAIDHKKNHAANDHIIVRFTEKGERQFEKIYFKHIIYANSDGNEVVIHVINKPKPFLITKTFTEFTSLLPLPQFARCHRSYVVNRQYINRWSSTEVHLINDVSLPIGSNYRNAFFDWWGQ